MEINKIVFPRFNIARAKYQKIKILGNGNCYNNKISKKYLIIIFFLIFFTISAFITIKYKNRHQTSVDNINIYLDKYETNIYLQIKEKLKNNRCSDMGSNQREFLNGVVRKFRPKKIVEIGVNNGGGSCIILNAIQDIENAHLYSIDLSNDSHIGKCVKYLFPQFLNKWTLFKGDVAAKFMEQIGNDIDMVFIDSAHFEPGEILDFIITLPFLKEGAIVGFHDIANQITANIGRNEWAPYVIYNVIRGKSYLPSGDILLKHDIGIKILDKNQKRYHLEYFRALGGQWQYFPKEKHIELITEYFKKYYDSNCSLIFKEAVEFNRNFVKNHPMKQLYRFNSD